MTLYEIISTGLTVIFGVATAILGYKTYQLNNRKLDLEQTLDAIKKFDENTAFSMFRTARQHEHMVWSLWVEKLQNLAKLHPEIPELVDAVGLAGREHGVADSIVTNMIQVYKLSGAKITEEKIDQWIRDGLIPDHYKTRFMSLIR